MNSDRVPGHIRRERIGTIHMDGSVPPNLLTWLSLLNLVEPLGAVGTRRTFYWLDQTLNWDTYRARRPEAQQDEPCSICHEPFTEQGVSVETPCHHWFHPSCIRPWCERHVSPTCPWCRNSLLDPVT
jgi:hypothetical protein